MISTQLVATSVGPVEIARTSGVRPTVLFFPGGHCSASTDCGQDLYTELGHEVISFSRPGYGRTQVGPMDAAAFSGVVAEVCRQLDVSEPVVAVGVSFGGLQAVEVAASLEIGVERLVLHSNAPSTLPYPDTRTEALVAPVVFSPAVQRATWWMVRQLIRTGPGLRAMLTSLSTLPAHEMWNQLSDAEKDRARAVFDGMGSGTGFANDLRQGRAGRTAERRAALERVNCPTLITASPHDGGASYAHAQDLRSHVHDSRLVDVPAPTHLFWIGRERGLMTDVVGEFLDG